MVNIHLTYVPLPDPGAPMMRVLTLLLPERVLNTGLIGALGGAVITVLGTIIVMCVAPRPPPRPKPMRWAFCALCATRDRVHDTSASCPLSQILQAQRAEVPDEDLHRLVAVHRKAGAPWRRKRRAATYQFSRLGIACSNYGKSVTTTSRRHAERAITLP